jgi:hypothetical protein
METTPVGVIVGLFQAISQKLPAFSDWDSQKHHHILNSNADVCHTMTEVRQHVNKYGEFAPCLSPPSHLPANHSLPFQSPIFEVAPSRRHSIAMILTVYRTSSCRSS